MSKNELIGVVSMVLCINYIALAIGPSWGGYLLCLLGVPASRSLGLCAVSLGAGLSCPLPGSSLLLGTEVKAIGEGNIMNI